MKCDVSSSILELLEMLHKAGDALKAIFHSRVAYEERFRIGTWLTITTCSPDCLIYDPSVTAKRVQFRFHVRFIILVNQGS